MGAMAKKVAGRCMESVLVMKLDQEDTLVHQHG